MSGPPLTSLPLIPLPFKKHEKPTYHDWIYQKVAYDDEVCVIDILNELAKDTYRFLCELEDYEVVVDEDSFIQEFNNHMYDQYR